MSNEWNPENVVNKLLEKQQFYIINSVLTNKVLDSDQLNGNLIFLNQHIKGKDTQEFTLVKKHNAYLIQSKTGAYLTRFHQGNQQKLYLDKKLKDSQSHTQLFRISSKIGLKGERIETLDKKAIGTFGKQNDRQNWQDVVLSDQNSQQNQLWNFTDVHSS